MKGTLEYRSNNSGGSWWLSDEDWKAMEEAGWKPRYGKCLLFLDREDFPQNFEEALAREDEVRWLGALATTATIETTREKARSVIEKWEDLTGMSVGDLGCGCCGPPHSFTFQGEDGSTDYYEPRVPTQGEW